MNQFWAILLLTCVVIGTALGQPLPEGFSEVTSLPGKYIQMALSTNGAPAIVFGTGDTAQSEHGAIYFTKWAGSWSKPVQIATLEDGGHAKPSIPIALAAVSKSWVVAYVATATSIELATSSDQGQNWTRESAVKGKAPVRSPVLAATEDGDLHLAYVLDDAAYYARGKLGTPVRQWKTVAIPPLANFTHFTGQLDLKLDAKGNPGIAFVLGGEGNSVGFWRPGSQTARVIDTRGQEVDGADVRLVFEGVQPRVVYYGRIDDFFNVEAGHEFWLAKSSDDGVNWESAFRIASDGNRMMTTPFSVAYGQHGRAAISAEAREGAVKERCGSPKLSRSENFQRFTTCGPALSGKPNFQAEYPSVLFAPDGALYLAFSITSPGDLKKGVWIWNGR